MSASRKSPSKDPAPAPEAGANWRSIVRHRLLDRLSAEPRPRLIVVQGPAGYGKTSLLRQHCERRAARGERIAWVRMDAQSGDAAHFLRLLCDAVAALAAPRRRSSGAPSIERPATLQDLLRGLSQIEEPVVLVVDNFETAASAPFEAVFAQVVRSLPMSVQLCVGTRVLPTARLARLQIREGTVVIANEELCFRPSETIEFFREFAALRPEEIAEIHERTDGWPAALQAFRLCLRRGARFRAEAYAGKGVTRELMDFLSAEMFDNLAPALGTLLLELAIPEKLSPALVEHITGEPRGAERLAEIERSGLFLAQADLEGTWLRFHNLFRQFLLTRAASLFPAEELRRRHRRIAQWFADNGWREEAIQHWLQAGETERAAEILAGIVDALVAQERLGLIETYADRMPTEALMGHPNLVHAAIIAYGFRRAFDKAERLLHGYAAVLDQTRANRAARALHGVSRLFVLAAQDRMEELGVQGAETARLLTDQSGWHYGVALNARAIHEVGRGAFEEARALMVRARPLHDRDHHAFGQTYRDAIASMTLSAQGRVGDAVQGLADALRRSEQSSAGGVSAGAVVAAYLASGLYEQNRVAEAERVIGDYGQLVEQQTIADAVATMDITRARIAHLQGRRGEAEETLERLLYLGYRHSLDRLVIYAHAELARLATLEGDLGQAERWLRELPAAFRDEPRENLLMFHAGENEACTVTHARWLIRSDRHAEARSLLGGEIRRAAVARRRRRELQLRLLDAIALRAGGKVKLAGRVMLEALEIGAGGGFVRSFLDEGAPAVALMKQARAPSGVRPDAVQAYLETLLVAAGEAQDAPAAATESRDEALEQLMASLTDRERNLLRFVSAGLSNRDLAERLSVSTNTVKWHLRNIFEKLHIKNRVQAITLARRFGLID
ncbi:MAG: regulatory protein LuxR [Panacagrimonas sp.]|nr:LuxR C-terminal-related transcriptional regulator [Panacagrimonas sp.]MCC2657893.1 regulatory protein LuxR [Panacagrimonas sp.]